MKNSGTRRMYEIVYPKSLYKDIRKIPPRKLAQIKRAIEKLADFPDVHNIRKLKAHPLSDFRLRVGDYRILFDVEEKSRRIIILKIAHRKEVY